MRIWHNAGTEQGRVVAVYVPHRVRVKGKGEGGEGRGGEGCKRWGCKGWG